MDAIIRVIAKCDDRCSVDMTTKSGDILFEFDGTYPPTINKLCGGDYIELSVDNLTGIIFGWKPLTKEDIKDILEN